MKQFFKFLFASILGFFISAMIIILFFVGIVSALKSSKGTTVIQDESVLVLNLSQVISERPTSDIFEKLSLMSSKKSQSLTLQSLLKSIKNAATDDRIKGIFIKGSYLSTNGLASFEEIHDALNTFKKSRKFILAYSDGYDLMSYYLASTAQKIYLNPMGDIDFKGLAITNTFYKGALDKLGVEMQIIRVGKYKSAVEPFFTTQMSDANREQSSVYINSIHHQILKDISQNRHIAVDSLQSISSELKIRNAKTALQYKFVDQLIYSDEMEPLLKKTLNISKDEDLNLVSINEYADAIPSDENQDAEHQIAVVYVNGEIVNGDHTEGSSENVVRALREVRENDNVKALVLRVNSPGGDGLASDLMWHEVELIRKAKKPVYVSMGDYAASGGYYVSCNADRIFAQPNTITGSIGVFGVIPNAQKFFNEKLGITFDGVKTGAHSDMMGYERPLSDVEKNILQQHVDEFYSNFIHKVAVGRHKTDAEISEIASGRVWTGADALKIGLVDQLGSFDQTIKAVAEKAKLKSYEIVEFQKEPSVFDKFIKEGKENVKTYFLKNELGEMFSYYQQFKNLNVQKGIVARIPYGTQIKY